MQRTRIRLWLTAALLMLAVSPVLAQEPAPNENNANDEANKQTVAGPANSVSETLETSNTDTLLGLIIESGPVGWLFMAILLVFSFVAVMISAERLVNLTRSRMLPEGFRTQLKQLCERDEDQPNEFQVICEKAPSPIARILHAGLLRAGRPLPEVEKSMEDAAAREMASLRARNRPLSVIASVAPLIGLLGTVVGMIFAFRTASEAGLGKADVLATGIYLALLTTAVGLTIAIPCLLLAAWFNGRVERYMREIDEQLMDTMPSFTRMERDRFAPVRERTEAFAESEG